MNLGAAEKVFAKIACSSAPRPAIVLTQGRR